MIIGGIIPDSDFDDLKKMGIQEIFTPKDYDLMGIMNKIIDMIQREAISV